MSDLDPPEIGQNLPAIAEKDLPGYTPMLEVHRLIRENGPNLAPQLFEDYKDHFEDTNNRNEEGFYEDPITKVVLQNGQTHREIRVFIGAENSNKTGYSLYNFPSTPLIILKTIKISGNMIAPQFTPQAKSVVVISPPNLHQNLTTKAIIIFGKEA